MKEKAYKDFTKQELNDKIQDLRKQLMELTFKKRTAQVEKPHLFKTMKKDIARMMTAIREKK